MTEKYFVFLHIVGHFQHHYRTGNQASITLIIAGFLYMAMFPMIASAQFTPGQGEDSITVSPNIAPFKKIVKFSVFAPIEEKNSIRLGIELTLNQHISIEPEIGFIYSNSIGSERLNSKMLNLEGRLGMRYYFPEKFITGLYTGPLITYAVDHYGTGVLRNYNPAYPDSSYYDFSNPSRYQENDFALFWIAGLQPVISKHFNFDISGGLGYQGQQIITRYNPYLPLNTNLPATTISYRILGIVCLKAGYIIY